tara:strand:- start:105 stop:611 length:507 start_codon:yes stop_codon:yes gene_type:complete
MAFLIKNYKLKFLELIPAIILLIISLNGLSVVDLKFFSFSIHYILIYYWVLKTPKILGYGFIFFTGVITDIVFGIPLGATSLASLFIAAVAAYVRVVIVNVSLINDWVSFIPALLIANFIFFMALYFSDYSVDYLSLLKNSFFTFIFYPVLWIIFGILLKLIKSNSHA